MNTMALKSHAKWLRKAAKEIRDKGHAGWGNTCEQAADAIVAHLARQSEVGDEDVRNLPALWRQIEQSSEPQTEFDKGYEQASRECADDLEAALASVSHNRSAQEKSDLPLERCLAFRAGALWGMCNPYCGSEPAVLHVSRPANDYCENPWKWDRDAKPAQEKAEPVACRFCGYSGPFDQWPCEWLDGSGANVVRCPRCHGAAPEATWNRPLSPAERVRVPDGDPMEALREERLTLLNGFGQGAFADGRLRDRIAEIDAMLSAAPEASHG